MLASLSKAEDTVVTGVARLMEKQGMGKLPEK
jgi:hypothetical protein